MTAVGDEDRGELGVYVKGLREQAGMTQKAVEKVTGGQLKASHLGNVEVGNVGMSRERVRLFSLAVNATTEEHAELERRAGLESEEAPVDQIAELRSEIRDLRLLVERLATVVQGLEQTRDRPPSGEGGRRAR